MAAQKQDDQHERTFSSYVRIQVVVLKTCLGRWTIGRSGERGSGISVLPARYDDDDDGNMIFLSFFEFFLPFFLLSIRLSLFCLFLSFLASFLPFFFSIFLFCVFFFFLLLFTFFLVFLDEASFYYFRVFYPSICIISFFLFFILDLLSIFILSVIFQF